MALGSTDPAVLANLATCFNCVVPYGEHMAIQSYLLALIAGVDTSQAGVQDLVNKARCFSCTIPPGDQLAVQNFLLVQLLT